MKRILASLLLVLLTAGATFGAELNGVSYEDKIQIDGKDLALNGLALRRVTKFGFPIKVYVGALYVAKKSTNSDEILESKEVKQISMQFLLSVDRDALVETFGAAYSAQCMMDCATASKQFVKLRDVITRVNKGDRMILTVYPDKLIFETTGANAKKTEIADAAVSKNTIAMYLNPKAPADPKFREALLGKKAD